uniref:Cullin domain-containing protein n=1 Tax=Strongyloides papillosus TaxID=174720 RepID=A0A0N5BWU5_STREA
MCFFKFKKTSIWKTLVSKIDKICQDVFHQVLFSNHLLHKNEEDLSMLFVGWHTYMELYSLSIILLCYYQYIL